MSTETLLKKLQNDGRYESMSMLEPLAAGQRIDAIEQWLLKAAEQYAENSCLYYYDLLTLAFREFSDDADMADRHLARFLFDELYPRLPEWEVARVYCHDRQGYVSENRETLIELKKRLFRDVAIRWRSTRDADEAAPLADFLEKAVQPKKPKQLEALNEALRTSMERVVHETRALQLTKRFATAGSAFGPARTLFFGVIRSLSDKIFIRIARLFVHLPCRPLQVNYREFAPDPVYDVLEAHAEACIARHQALYELWSALQLKKSEITKFEPSYTLEGHVNLSVSVSLRYSLSGKEENDFHEAFSEACTQIREWIADQKSAGKTIFLIKLEFSLHSHFRIKSRLVRSDSFK